MKNFITTLLFSCSTIFCMAQSTNISGIINTYASVTGISGDTVTMTSTSGFSLDDQILIIQMQGTTIDESNSTNFGNITSNNSAGNHEYQKVSLVLNGTQLVLNGIERTYTPSGIVQIILVPVYTNAVITSTLTAAPWNGATGGILAFKCSGTLLMNDNIDLQGLGFRGGAVTTSSYDCSWLFDQTDYFYTISSGEGAMKGEGVALYITNKTGGRGAQANGGGGANDHNGGGGGGANASSGGLGGERIKRTPFTCGSSSPGVGGRLNTYTNTLNKVFLGGGGGAGHENNAATATAGANGGGIVMINADTLIGNGNSINVDGELIAFNSTDGAGGGGAAGSVLLDVSTYTGNVIVSAKGSAGGDVSNEGTSNCNGPGGGGSGGVLWINQNAVPSGITLQNNGGGAGITTAASQANCTLGGTNNATAGNTGITVTGLSLFNTPCNSVLTTQSATICNSDSIFLSGSWQFSPGLFQDTINLSSCDSIHETTLMVLPASGSTITQTICAGEDFILNETTYNASVTGASEVFKNVNNCDSTVTLNLTVLDTIDTSILISGDTITANQTGATYQWISCKEGYTEIDGETNRSFISNSGNYAVVITIGSCTDTTDCYSINDVGISENNFDNKLKIYPNPTTGNFSIDLGRMYQKLLIQLTDLGGKSIFSKQYNESQLLDLTIEEPAGIYLLTLESGEQKTVIRLVKE